MLALVVLIVAFVFTAWFVRHAYVVYRIGLPGPLLHFLPLSPSVLEFLRDVQHGHELFYNWVCCPSPLPLPLVLMTLMQSL
jgi:hypothetical protein